LPRIRALGRWWPAVLIVALTVPALMPLWQPGLQQTDDGMHHLFRLFNLDLALRSGYWGTRWFAEEGFGYGFPVLNFYAPLGYYIGLVFHLLGAGFATSLELALASGLVVAALAMYAFARRLLGSAGGALAAVAYTWAPYHLADAWTRGALGEHWALVWLPLLLLALLNIARAKGKERLWPAFWGGIVLAALVLTHNLTIVLAAPALVGWGLFLLFVEVHGPRSRRRCVGACALMGLLGMSISAAFWLPALTELKYVWASQVPITFEDWARGLAPPQDLVAETWVHLYTFAQQPRVLHALGQAQVVVMVIGLATGAARWRHLDRPVRLALPLFLSLALLALLLQSYWSRFLWQALPGLLFLQFPWRWQAISALNMALISGYAVYLVKAPKKGVIGDLTAEAPSSNALRESGPSTKAVPEYANEGVRHDLLSLWDKVRARAYPIFTPTILTFVLAAVLISGALPRLPWEQAKIPTTDVPISDENVGLQSMASYDYGRGLWLRQYGEPWMFEYMPQWAQALRSEFFVSAGPTAGEEPSLTVKVTMGDQDPLTKRFQVEAPASWTLQLHQFYFPGWQASIDGQVVETHPAGPLGLVSVEVPAGAHEVVFHFGTSSVRRVGWAVSLAGIGLFLVGLLWLRRWRWLIGPLVLALIFAWLAVRERQANPSDYVPQAATANFGGEAELVGFHSSLEQLKPGQEAMVTLDWLALRRPATDYKVFVHLVDGNGQLCAQQDGEPGFFFSPTSRWQRGEIVEDQHVLPVDGPLPPGHYQLRVGLYDPVAGTRLPILGPDGTPGDNEILLAEFDVK